MPKCFGVRESVLHYATLSRIIWPYLISSLFVKCPIMDCNTLQVLKPHFRTKTLLKRILNLYLSFTFFSGGIKNSNWANYNISTLSFYRMVPRTFAFLGSEQSFASAPRFGKSDIVQHAPKLRLSFEHFQSQGQTKILPFGYFIKLLCQLLIPLGTNSNNIYGWDISFDNNQLNIAHVKGLYRFTFSTTICNKSEREEKFHSEANLNWMNRAKRSFSSDSPEKQVVLLLSNYWNDTRTLKRKLYSELTSDRPVECNDSRLIHIKFYQVAQHLWTIIVRIHFKQDHLSSHNLMNRFWKTSVIFVRSLSCGLFLFQTPRDLCFIYQKLGKYLKLL